MAKKRSLRAYLGNIARRAMGSERPRPPSAKPEAWAPRSVLFLGGSNTLMTRGYASVVVECLTDRYGPLDKATNYAVGGNSIVHGLMLAKGLPDLDDYDLVVIEYGVNDVKLSGPRTLPTWRAAAEGLIRHLLDGRPDRRIVFAQFHRRRMRGHEFRPAAELRDLVAYYGQTHRVSAVDIDGLLRGILFPDREVFNSLYVDNAHFRRPVISGFVGALIAAEVGAATITDPAVNLPKPVRGWNFQSAEVVDFVPDRARAERVFKNSRFVLPTRLVPVGEEISVELPGPLIGIEFVSTRGAASLRATEGAAQPFAMQTLHPRVGGDKYPFLLRCKPMFWKQWNKGVETGRRDLRIESLLAPTIAELAGQRNILPEAPGKTEAIYLSRALCLA